MSRIPWNVRRWLFQRARAGLALCLLLSLLAGCGAPALPTPTSSPAGSTTSGLTLVRSSSVQTAAQTGGGQGSMRLLLSQGTPAAAAAESVPVGDTQPLTTDQTLAVLKRLPALAALPGEQQAFRLPAET